MSRKVTASFTREQAAPLPSLGTESGGLSEQGSSLKVQDSFSSGSSSSYAGSFRLRFLGSSGKKKKKRKRASDDVSKTSIIEDAPVDVQPIDSEHVSSSLQKQPSLIQTEYQEDSLTFTTEASAETERAFAESKRENQVEAVLDAPQHSSRDDDDDPQVNEESNTVANWNLDEIFHVGVEGAPHSSQDTGNPLITTEHGSNTQTLELTNKHDIELLPGDNAPPQPTKKQQDDDDFQFYSPEQEPKLHPGFEKRAVRAVTSVAFEGSDTHTNCCQSGIKCCCEFEIGNTGLTPELKNANDQGWKMFKKLLFPGMPKLMQDIWVLCEVAVTLSQLILSIVSLSIENNRAFNIVYLVLASIGVLLASIDAFIYFIQLGSCMQCFRFLRKKTKRGSQTDKDIESDSRNCCSCLSAKTKQTISEYFEVTRNVVTELVIYPLLICDMFDFIVGGSLNSTSAADRVNYALFVIGCFYLFLGVYLVRAFIVISSTVHIRRIPIDASKSLENTVSIVTSFSIHVMGQLVSSILIIVTIGVKIRQENPISCVDDTSPCITASGFLVYAAIAGGVLPIFGTASYFIVYYYDLRTFSIGYWIDMMSLLQAESFAELVFGGTGVKVAKEKVKEFAGKVKLKKVKQQFEEVKKVSFWYKSFYAFKLPFLAVFGIIYELLLVSFIVSLFFSGDATNGFRFVLFEENLSLALLIMAAILILVNIRLLLLFTFWLLALPLWPVIFILLYKKKRP